jgi:hypothetical protein
MFFLDNTLATIERSVKDKSLVSAFLNVLFLLKNAIAKPVKKLIKHDKRYIL